MPLNGIHAAESEEEKGLESQIGRFGLAWMGNIVLLFGITFLTQYLINLGHQVAAVILGYIAAAQHLFSLGLSEEDK